MRLLNTKSRKLEYFQDDTPPYVILSHTWGEGEVTYEDISGSGTLFHLRGYQKISRCCEVAISDGYEHIWIDTCCIDKTSSAELSEAINSMFRWYRDADTCYAYLSDVNHEANPRERDLELAESRWFTRGWTLQELIAPTVVVFYDSNWMEIGTKISLREALSKVTGIPTGLLVDGSCHNYSVAQRMSWASRRRTTREEDRAYCLMGIFGVNMPLLYGEGRKSFIRLQEEIMKRSDDHSLFAWRNREESSRGAGMLATSPRQFSESGNIERLVDEPLSLPYSITNKGVRIALQFLQPGYYNFQRGAVFQAERGSPSKRRKIEEQDQSLQIYCSSTKRIALLNCQMSDAPGISIAIVLEWFDKKGVYLRTHHHNLLINSGYSIYNRQKPVQETIFVGLPNRDLTELESITALLQDSLRCQIRTLPSRIHGFFVFEQYLSHGWTWSETVKHIDLWEGGMPTLLLFRHSDGNMFAVLLQTRHGRVYADIEWHRGEEEDFHSLGAKALKPQDRITFNISREKVVSVNIRRTPGAHLVDISIRETSAKPQFSPEELSKVKLIDA